MVLPSCRGSRNDQSFCVLMSFGMRTLFISSEVTHMPNAKVLESKKAIVDALAEKLQNSTSAVFVDYKGITVAQDTELRRKFREAGVEYTVVKNTLTRFAANKAGYNQFDELLNGTTSMACTSGDPIAPARIVCEFAKKNKNIVSLKGGFVEGSVMSIEQLQGFGELPSKDALVAQVLGTFLAPISSLAFVLDQIRAQKEGPAAEPAAE
jgi:large subunit ribosomal protein L10